MSDRRSTQYIKCGLTRLCLDNILTHSLVPTTPPPAPSPSMSLMSLNTFPLPILFDTDWCRRQNGLNLIMKISSMPQVVPVTGALIYPCDSWDYSDRIGAYRARFLTKIPRADVIVPVVRAMASGEIDSIVVIPEIGVFEIEGVVMMNQVSLSITGINGRNDSVSFRSYAQLHSCPS